MNKKAGEKFTERYKVSSATIYKDSSGTDALQIPPSNHPLYDSTSPTTFDEQRVQAIDRDGQMTDPIEVWTDPDTGTLWVLDGRSRLLDVREVNRRRALDGREPVAPYLVPFNVPGADEKRAIARVRERNYHRRVPTPSDKAIDLAVLRNQGYSWEACAGILHVSTTDPEQWGRKLMPLSFCVAEVRAAVDAGKLPQSAATKFGGPTLDGSKKLGRAEQLALLAEMTAEKAPEGKKKSAKAVSAKSRERLSKALQNGATHGLGATHKHVAFGVAATLAWLKGDSKAFKAWPEVAAIIEKVLAEKTEAKKG